MRCPTCDHIEDRVVDSRLSRGGRAIRCRRECIACGQRFTTYELVEREPLTVRKSSGAIEPYDRHKLLRSIRIACAKRPVSLTEIEDMVDAIEESLDASDAREVSSQSVGELVMHHLQGTDHVAYVRFASVYRNFQDTTEFREVVQVLGPRARSRARGQQELFDAQDEASE